MSDVNITINWSEFNSSADYFTSVQEFNIQDFVAEYCGAQDGRIITLLVGFLLFAVVIYVWRNFFGMTDRHHYYALKMFYDLMLFCLPLILLLWWWFR